MMGIIMQLLWCSIRRCSRWLINMQLLSFWTRFYFPHPNICESYYSRWNLFCTTGQCWSWRQTPAMRIRTWRANFCFSYTCQAMQLHPELQSLYCFCYQSQYWHQGMRLYIYLPNCLHLTRLFKVTSILLSRISTSRKAPVLILDVMNHPLPLQPTTR